MPAQRPPPRRTPGAPEERRDSVGEICRRLDPIDHETEQSGIALGHQVLDAIAHAFHASSHFLERFQPTALLREHAALVLEALFAF